MNCHPTPIWTSVHSQGRSVLCQALLTSQMRQSPQGRNQLRPLGRPTRLIHHADRRQLQRHVQSDVMFHRSCPSLRGHMRLASSIPGKLIPLPSSGSIPELSHVAKVESCRVTDLSRKHETGFGHINAWKVLATALTSPGPQHAGV